MVEKGAEYAFADDREPNLGWIFCPEFAGLKPLDISPGEWDTRMYLFGPQPLPDTPSAENYGRWVGPFPRRGPQACRDDGKRGHWNSSGIR